MLSMNIKPQNWYKVLQKWVRYILYSKLPLAYQVLMFKDNPKVDSRKNKNEKEHSQTVIMGSSKRINAQKKREGGCMNYRKGRK